MAAQEWLFIGALRRVFPDKPGIFSQVTDRWWNPITRYRAIRKVSLGRKAMEPADVAHPLEINNIQLKVLEQVWKRKHKKIKDVKKVLFGFGYSCFIPFSLITFGIS